MKNKIILTLSDIQINDKFLEEWYYLLIIKKDILIIDGNFNNKKPIFTMKIKESKINENTFTFINKKDKVEINIKKIIFKKNFPNIIKMDNINILEKDRKIEIISFIKENYPNLNIIEELEVDSWFIDIIINKEDEIFIIELKNRILQKKDVYQLKRYSNSLSFQNKNLILIGTSFSKDIKLYCIENNVTPLTYNNYQKWIKEKL